jgi:polyisoprenoid-binding protein YceI
MNRIVLASIAALLGAGANAAPITYVLDSAHTYPSFEADHMGGVSVWRGKFTSTSGTVVLDRAAKAGSIEVNVDAGSVSLGMEKLDEHVKSADFLDVAKFPTATFKGKFTKFNGDAPTEAQGTFTLHGVTRPLTLSIDRFFCKEHPMKHKEVCGADATATFNRSDYGVNWGDKFGFKMDTKLQIQVEGSPAA